MELCVLPLNGEIRVDSLCEEDKGECRMDELLMKNKKVKNKK